MITRQHRLRVSARNTSDRWKTWIVPLFESLGTTIEDMAAGFIKFSAIYENLPLLKAYLGIENAPAEAGARMELHHRVFKQVFDIATKNTR